MKKVLISIHPKWCELIFNGRKTIEVRKSFPKQLETPFKVYVYQTKHKGKSIVSEALNTVYGGGKVIGSFVCNSATCCQAYYGEGGEKHLTNTFGIDLKRACLTEDELFNYIIGKHGEIGTGWLWHITAPKLYDKPKELGEFRKVCLNGKCSDCIYEECKITRPPQSWQYLEDYDNE